jgi:hypothetical protein
MLATPLVQQFMNNNTQKKQKAGDAQPLPKLEIFSYTFDLTYK